MSTVTRLSRFQRLRYMNPENYLDGTLCFWRITEPGSLIGYNKQAYEEALSEWMKGQVRNLKPDNRNV